MKRRILAIGMCMMMLAGCGKNTTSKADAVTADIQETTAQATREEAFDQEESLPDVGVSELILLKTTI